MMDLAVIARAQRETLEQRSFVEKYQGSVDDVIKIFPFLWKCLFVSTGQFKKEMILNNFNY